MGVVDFSSEGKKSELKVLLHVLTRKVLLFVTLCICGVGSASHHEDQSTLSDTNILPCR